MALSFAGIANNPELRGQLAAPKVLFGDQKRYAVAPVHTRFAAVQFFIWDADTIDPVTGGPDVIRQFDDISDVNDFIFSVN